MKKHPLLLLVLLAGYIVLAGCNKNDLLVKQQRNASVRSMGEFIKNNYDLSLLAVALEKTGLLDSLDMPGPFTMMAPDNKAFGEIGITNPADFDRMNTDSLRFALKYHILPVRLYLTEIPNQMDNVFRTLNGYDMYISNPLEQRLDATIFVNGAEIQRSPKRDVELTNGALHVIDRPLRFQHITIQEYIAGHPQLTLFVAAMKKFQLWDAMKDEGSFTVFAPVNDAFLQAGLTEDSIARMQPQNYYPDLFGIYPMSFRKRHIYSCDYTLIYYLTGDYNQWAAASPGYVLKPTDGGIGIGETSSPEINPGGTTPGYANWVGGRAGGDLTFTNGIVNLVDQMFLYTDSLKIR